MESRWAGRETASKCRARAIVQQDTSRKRLTEVDRVSLNYCLQGAAGRGGAPRKPKHAPEGEQYALVGLKEVTNN